MQKEIRYSGHTATPSDYQSPDGDLSISFNAIPEDGAIRRIAKPKTVLTLPKGQHIVYIHAVSVRENYIIHDTGAQSLKWIPSTGNTGQPTELLSLSGRELYQVTAIGNTLLILTSEGILYAVFNTDRYKTVHRTPVPPSISFRLHASMRESEVRRITFEKFQRLDFIEPGRYLMSGPAREALKNSVMTYVNPLQASIKERGGFQYPFFIRYAYRMYDGSLGCISQPVMMQPSNGVPHAIKHIKSDESGGYISGYEYQVYSLAASLYYKIENLKEVRAAFAEWKDLVRSIDMFISPSLTTIDEDSIGGSGPLMEGAVSTMNSQLYSLCCYQNEAVANELIYRQHGSYSLFPQGTEFFKMGSKTLHSDGGPINFYHIGSIYLKDLSETEVRFDIEQGVLTTLETRERIEGDTDIKDNLIARNSYIYNARVNLADVSVSPRPFTLHSSIAFCNGTWDHVARKPLKTTYTYKAYVLLSTSQCNVRVKNESNIPLNIDSGNSYFFYPNVNAKEVIIERTDSSGTKAYSRTPMKEHEGLDGAYAYIRTGFDDTVDMNTLGYTDLTIPYPNKIYTSEVNNPFRFTAVRVTTVGTGRLIGISSAAKALSEGQFGQFPLYAFTDEGVWALEVSSTGGYIARQPITRDVCIHAGSITQIDSSVLFASDRGIMHLSGSSSVCISEAIDSSEPLSLASLPKGNEILRLSALPMTDIAVIPFRDYLKQCRILYDYTHQRILVYNTAQPYAYVFSLESKAWGMMESPIASGINSYPEALAMDKDGRLLNYSEETDEAVTALLLTRPLKLDTPDVHKTVSLAIQRGIFQKGQVQQVLFGSNDYTHWHVIASSVDHYLRGFSGTPFKAFRLALIGRLDKTGTLSGCSIQFVPKHTNRPR